MDVDPLRALSPGDLESPGLLARLCLALQVLQRLLKVYVAEVQSTSVKERVVIRIYVWLRGYCFEAYYVE